jgi:hypothetical protein
MTDLDVWLSNSWRQRFGHKYTNSRRDGKILQDPSSGLYFEAEYLESLAEWYESPAGKKRYSDPECFFCNEHDAYRKLETVWQSGHLRVYQNAKFCRENHFLIAPYDEHREQATIADIEVLYNLAQASGLSIFGNFRDAGASYPDHVHFQSLRIEFPLVHRSYTVIGRNEHATMSLIDYPVLAVSLEPNDQLGVKTAAQIFCGLAIAANIVLDQKRVIILPRQKSVPSNTNGFKFAAAEMAGTIFCRQRDFFDRLDFNLTLVAIKEVGYASGSQAAKQLQQQMLKHYQEISHGEI